MVPVPGRCRGWVVSLVLGCLLVMGGPSLAVERRVATFSAGGIVFPLTAEWQVQEASATMVLQWKAAATVTVDLIEGKEPAVVRDAVKSRLAGEFGALTWEEEDVDVQETMRLLYLGARTADGRQRLAAVIYQGPRGLVLARASLPGTLNDDLTTAVFGLLQKARPLQRGNGPVVEAEPRDEGIGSGTVDDREIQMIGEQ